MKLNEEGRAYMAQVLAMSKARFDAMPPIITPTPAACEICNGLGVIRLNVPPSDHRFGKLQPCPSKACEAGKEARERHAEARYKTARLPKEYQLLTFETWQQLPDGMKDEKWAGYGACMAFSKCEGHYVGVEDMYTEIGADMKKSDFYAALGVEDDQPARNCIVLYGKPGVGKTGLMAATINAIRENGGTVRYTRCRDIFEEIYARQKSEEYPLSSDVLHDYKTFSGVLAIDEANLEDYTSARLDWMQTIIRWRLAERLPTMLTCNLTRDEFEKAWGMWTFAVLNSKAWWIHMKGKNVRRVAKTLED